MSSSDKVNNIERYPFHRSEEKLKQPTVAEYEVLPRSQPENTWHGKPEIPGWQETITIERSIGKRLTTTIINLLLLLFPFAYLALGIVIAVLNGRSVDGIVLGGKYRVSSDQVAHGITAAIKQAVTAWPIGFGIVLCRALKTLASYKAERGTRLMTLEQIMASKSFGSSLLAPLTFKTCNLLMLALFGVWALSPIMTQALQNIFSVGVAISNLETIQITYFKAQAARDRFSGLSGNPADLFSINTILLTSMMLPAKQYKTSKVDFWGNPKIPTIESVQQYPKDSEGWHLLESQPSENSTALNGVLQDPSTDNPNLGYSFSSMVGQPIAGIQKNTSNYGSISQFKLQTGYFSLECSPFKELSEEQLEETAAKCSKNYDSCWGAWACAVPPNSSYSPGTCDNTYIRPLFLAWNLVDSEYPVQLFFASIVKRQQFILTPDTPPEKSWYQATTCNVSSRRVESQLSCAGIACSVAKMRFLSDQPLIRNPDASYAIAILQDLVQASMPTGAGDEGGGYQMTLLQSWLFDPAGPLQGIGTKDPKPPYNMLYPNLSSIPIATFNQRLALLLTTYFQAGISPTALLEGPQHDWNPGNGLSGYYNVSSYTETTPGHAQKYYTVYKCNMVWFGVLVFSCAVIVVLVLVGAFLSANVLGPDFMGYVSTLTYHNPYMVVPRGGSLMDGIERTRKLANLKVKMQDVFPAQPVGHVALSSVDGAPLQRGRTYW